MVITGHGETLCGPQRMLRVDFTTHVRNCHMVSTSTTTPWVCTWPRNESCSQSGGACYRPRDTILHLSPSTWALMPGSPPRTESELQRWYQKEILEDADYEKKGEFMRQSSWYSILKVVRKNEGKWHCRKYHAQKVADQLVKSPEGKRIVADTASPIKQLDNRRSREGKEKPAMTSQQFKFQMRKLCKAAGNSLLLAPKFFHTENLINARIMWLCGCTSYTEQAYWGERKTTGETDRDLIVKYAIAFGEEMPKQMGW